MSRRSPPASARASRGAASSCRKAVARRRVGTGRGAASRGRVGIAVGVRAELAPRPRAAARSQDDAPAEEHPDDPRDLIADRCVPQLGVRVTEEGQRDVVAGERRAEDRRQVLETLRDVAERGLDIVRTALAVGEPGGDEAERRDHRQGHERRPDPLHRARQEQVRERNEDHAMTPTTRSIARPRPSRPGPVGTEPVRGVAAAHDQPEDARGPRRRRPTIAATSCHSGRGLAGPRSTSRGVDDVSTSGIPGGASGRTRPQGRR